MVKLGQMLLGRRLHGVAVVQRRLVLVRQEQLTDKRALGWLVVQARDRAVVVDILVVVEVFVVEVEVRVMWIHPLFRSRSLEVEQRLVMVK